MSTLPSSTAEIRALCSAHAAHDESCFDCQFRRLKACDLIEREVVRLTRVLDAVLTQTSDNGS